MTLTAEERSRLTELFRSRFQGPVNVDLSPQELAQVQALLQDRAIGDVLGKENGPIVNLALVESTLKGLSDSDIDQVYKFLIEELSFDTSQDFQWLRSQEEDSRQSKLRLDNYCRLLLAEKLISVQLPSEDLRSLVIDRLAAYYSSENCPWSSDEVSKICAECLDKMKISEEEILSLLETYRESSQQIIDSGSKITRAGHRRLRSKREWLKDLSPLVGTSFSQIVNERELFVRRNIYRINGLKLAADRLSAEKLDRNWGLVFPLTMSFLDDTETLVKAEACTIILRILNKLTPGKQNIIARSGVEPVIFDSIVPIILALPSMTPKEKSCRALPIAYKTIFKLWNVTENESLNLKLSMLLNDFICPSIVKVKDIPELVLILLDVIKDGLVPEAGDYVIVLRKQILYTILDVLTDPFIVYSLTVVNACLNTIRALNGLKKNRYDIIGCLLKLQIRIKRSYSDRTNSTDTIMALSTVQNTSQSLIKDLDLSSSDTEKLLAAAQP
ncbi:DEKNAAC103375 [Brettanomyces naardenensis]|uniref:DEKNAAC103375 n=1 Tax=Brettanomyces naardenensis TaxID=13370 RepID=A0A448YNV3_BRENA|nr:DEKNAAC103375 [Brettanomyces naardenensis]